MIRATAAWAVSELAATPNAEIDNIPGESASKETTALAQAEFQKALERIAQR